jgi:quinol monooxygenase YgiN
VFAARLLVAAFTIIGAVVMLIDPLSGKLGTDMPVASQHYQLFPMSALNAGYAVSAISLIAYFIVAIVRRGEPGGMPRVLAGSGAGGAGVLIVISSALGLPGVIHAVVACLAAVAIWYGGSRRAVPPEDDEDDEDDLDERGPHPAPPRGRRARHGGSPLEEMRRGEAANRVGHPTEPSPQVDEGMGAGMGAPVASGGAVAPYRGSHGGDPYDRGPGDRPYPDRPPYGEPPYGEQPYDDRQPQGGIPPYGEPPYGGGPAPAVNGAGSANGLGLPVAAGIQRGQDIGPSPHLYGFISIFTLSDGQGGRFDQLTADALAYVRESEPDTLIYVAHTVPNAPLQRIFYEVYRNREAYDEHGRQPHVQRFRAERAACVIATNVIELKLEAAKISPVGPLFGDPTRH